MLKKEQYKENVNNFSNIDINRTPNWDLYDKQYKRLLAKVRSEIVEEMARGEVFCSKDIQALTTRELKTKSTADITVGLAHTRRMLGFPNLSIGSGKYRGSRFYFDSSLDLGKIDFDGVIKRIDASKPVKN